MSESLSILYYTANRIADRFASAVRRELVRMTEAPIIVVSQSGSPHHELGIDADFANRIQTFINVGYVAPSIAQVYRNVLLAAKAAYTPYVAMCEDDSLYVREHFTFRPPRDVFAYNENRWILSRRLADDGRSRVAHFFYNPRTQLAMGLCARDLLIETLEERFAKHSDPPLDTNVAKQAGFGEPGRYEKNLGLPRRAFLRVKWTALPCLTVNHADSLMGRRQYRDDMPSCEVLEPWGDANALWRRIVG